MTHRQLARAALVFGLLSAPCTVRAQDNSAAVESLFAEGKKLMTEGKVSEACPKFLASFTLEARVGTLLNLAACYEKNGQVASAWGRFVEARTLATRNNQPERATYAAQHAAALEPRRSMLTIVVPNVPGALVVKRDGIVIDPAVYGIGVPVDGGVHAIEASAPGKVPLKATVTVAPEGDKKSYSLPALADAPVASATAVPAPAPSAAAGREATTTNAAAPPESHGMPTAGIVGLGLAGAGVIAAGIGIGFGVEALSKNNDSNANGNCTGNLCNQTGFDTRSSARTAGDLSTVLIGVGAAAVVGGGILWLTAPKGRSNHVGVGVGPGSVHVQGTF
ncbi:MAG TPA: hypothetical protein VGI39_26915 [Polyangiaceae bacterium]|jgi:hypothetical protein